MASTNFISLSRAISLQRSMDVTAHNLANASTAGFKSMRPVFQSMIGSEGNGGEINFVKDQGDFIDSRQGGLIHTENRLDIALSGEGWFAFEGPNGSQALGRNGRLSVNADGDLVSSTGFPILSESGAVISLATEDIQTLTIASDGTISSEVGGVLSKIGVFSASEMGGLVSIGNGLYEPASRAEINLTPIDKPVISQGYFETSNVQPILEMTRMIDVQRAYERTVKLMGGDEDLTRQAVRRFGRTL